MKETFVVIINICQHTDKKNKKVIASVNKKAAFKSKHFVV